jgi:hypothetical protein
MNEFVERQFTQLRFQIADYRKGHLGLAGLASRVEALARAVGGAFWEVGVAPIAYDLELINSEVIDKNRALSLEEHEEVERQLRILESVIANGAPGSPISHPRQ